jgi:hypothetical protein
MILGKITQCLSLNSVGMKLLFFCIWLTLTIFGCYYLITYNTSSGEFLGTLVDSEVVHSGGMDNWYIKEIFNKDVTNGSNVTCSIFRYQPSYSTEDDALEAQSFVVLYSTRRIWSILTDPNRCYDSAIRAYETGFGLLVLLVPNGFLALFFLACYVDAAYPWVKAKRKYWLNRVFESNSSSVSELSSLSSSVKSAFHSPLMSSAFTSGRDDSHRTSARITELELPEGV